MTTDKPMITIVTQQATNFSSMVVVVDCQPSCKFIFVPFAYGALAFLTGQEFLVLLKGYAVEALEVRGSRLILRHRSV